MAMPDTVARWTLSELHRLPDDGNRYELVRGELLVTPPPSYRHQRIVEVLASLLQPYVAANALGTLSFPRSVVRIGADTEVEPDLMVRPVPRPLPATWDDAPVPILVVEVASGTTRRRDRTNKRRAYVDAAIAEYWIVDGERRSIRVVRPGREDADLSASLTWQPPGASEPFTLDVAGLFRTALGEESTE
jgi:Uma2 family endonuclease